MTDQRDEAAQEVDVEVLVKQGCHLCEEALSVTAEVCAEFGLSHRSTDITEDAALAARFAEEIPVLRIDGVVRDFWRFDAGRMRRLIAEAQPKG